MPSGKRAAAASAMVPCPFTHQPMAAVAPTRRRATANTKCLRMEEFTPGRSLTSRNLSPAYPATLWFYSGPGKNLPVIEAVLEFALAPARPGAGMAAMEQEALPKLRLGKVRLSQGGHFNACAVCWGAPVRTGVR